jgi:hypothetical protein
MNGSVGIIFGLILLIAQGMVLKTLYANSGRGGRAGECEVLTLSPEVKAYIDSKLGAATGGGDDAQLLRRLGDLEQQAGRLDYLRSTLTALEEAQSRLGRMSLEQPVSAAAVTASAREMELQRFRTGLDKICSGNDDSPTSSRPLSRPFGKSGK